MGVVKVLAVVVVTATVTLVCIRFGQAMAKLTPVPTAGTSYGSDDGGGELVNRDRQKPLAAAANNTVAVANAVTPKNTSVPGGPTTVRRPAPVTHQRANGTAATPTTVSPPLDLLGTVGIGAVGPPITTSGRGQQSPVAGQPTTSSWPINYRGNSRSDDSNDDGGGGGGSGHEGGRSINGASIIVDTGVYRVDHR